MPKLDVIAVSTRPNRAGFPLAQWAFERTKAHFLVHEWAHKPVSFLSYGGPAGGTRAVQMVKPMLVALKMMPLQESVMVPLFAHSIDANQVFTPSAMQEDHTKMMLDALAKWVPALASLR